uniref:Neutral and basic amino acid transport protein rBAT-like isoform X2 n=1 Tax=Saccoglossus kowalevskii TaxID=10224 RepID=A0ABM0MJP7_SACKO|nr:PREDICTED: neutral and basic amino acid transport protein rBAT-like isoform X2 [Saccoglossus kowalevskii]
MSDTERDVEKGEEVQETKGEENAEEKPKETQEEKAPEAEKPEENEVNVKLLPTDDDDDDEDEHKEIDADAVYIKDGQLADPEAVEVKVSHVEHQGLGKEELMKRCNTPAWKATRIALLVLFWLAWFAMLVAVIILIATAPKCPRNKEWYQSGVSYQIYPRSFKDSDADGNGDLKGIEKKIDYLKDIGINTIWLGQIFPTGKANNMGRYATNFTAIDEDLGDEEDFQSLLEKVHAEGMRLIMEFIPNHSSDEHSWFEMSRQSADNQYSNYYVWESGSPDKPPNNWLSRFGNSAWTYEPLRKQWYLHTFSENEPDLNFHNDNVTKEISNAMEYWLKQGVDGFYLPYANQLVEQATFKNEADNTYFKSNVNNTVIPYESLIHNITRDQPETFDLLAKWRILLDTYSGPDSDDYKLLVAGAQSSAIATQVDYYGNKKKVSDYPYNFQLMDLCSTSNKTGKYMSALITSWLNSVGSIGPERITNWALGDSERSRVSTRCGRNLVKAMNTLLMTLPGSPTSYYGDEIGMNDVDVDSTAYSGTPVGGTPEINYYISRDNFMSPMQWTDEDFSGFTNGSKAWYSINNDYKDINVAKELNDSMSIVSKFKALQNIRREPSLIGGQLNEVLVSDDIYSFSRTFNRWPSYFVALNLGNIGNVPAFHSAGKGLPKQGKLQYSTHSSVKPDETVDFDSIQLAPYEAIIVKFEK